MPTVDYFHSSNWLRELLNCRGASHTGPCFTRVKTRNSLGGLARARRGGRGGRIERSATTKRGATFQTVVRFLGIRRAKTTSSRVASFWTSFCIFREQRFLIRDSRSLGGNFSRRMNEGGEEGEKRGKKREKMTRRGTKERRVVERW